MNNFAIPINENGKIICFLTGAPLDPKPEEFVRQRFLRILHFEYLYPKDLLDKEVPIQYGHSELLDSRGNRVRADIVVYFDKKAKAVRDQGQIQLVVECKAPDKDTGYSQLVSYIFNTSANGGIWYNGSGTEEEIEYYRRLSTPNNRLIPWIGLPRFGEAWDALGRRRKSDLARPKDIKGLLRRCHNKLHARGTEGEEEDLTMDMVRIILAKAMDEEDTGEFPHFYCTPEEYNTEQGRTATAARIHGLFNKVVSLNPQVFSPHEKITVGARAICDVVNELQTFRLLSDLRNSDDWDIMGHAYEEYTATYLKKKKGQFFTNRLVVDLMVSCLDPVYTDIILDPAGGSGGFLTGAMRYVRKKILDSNSSEIAKQRQLDHHRTRLFMVEMSKRLVKVAKTAMILNGDGHTGMTQGDSLGDFTRFEDTILAQCSKGKPTIVITNPPFAGVGDGRITHEDILGRFDCGKKWTKSQQEGFQPTQELLTEGAPPELLFFERCLEWLAPGGKMGIVLPKSFLDTQTYLTARTLLFRNAKLLAAINCHKNTFQPHTGVRTCILLLEKRKADEALPEDYPIFMAISHKVGQDSEGQPIFKRDAQNNLTEELDSDLDEIARAFQQFQKGELKRSEHIFSVKLSEIDAESLRINPQSFLPSLNATLKQVASLDGADGWTVTTLGQAHADIRIYKGPRFKSENIIVDKKENEGTEPYYTPSAVLQENSDSVKYVDVSRANASQLRTISEIRVSRGDLVITRSGSIGRVAYITKRLDGAIVSDDLIRIRIPNEKLRLYVFYFLQTKYAQDQMLRNEYGAVQQHLEPEHVKNLLIPIPDDWSQAQHLIDGAAKAIQFKEEYFDTHQGTITQFLKVFESSARID